jgi:hypothetical protein
MPHHNPRQPQWLTAVSPHLSKNRVITGAARLRANTDEVAAEVIDGEAVLINLSNGTYFTMDGIGAVVWSMIEHGYSLEEMSSDLASSYAADRDQVLADLAELAQELLGHRLIVIGSESPSVRSGAVEMRLNGASYQRPILTTYTDMAEVLALDPPLPVLKDES